jgi:hypothetical protein
MPPRNHRLLRNINGRDQKSLILHIQLDTLSASTDIKFTISPAVDDFLAAFESFSVCKKQQVMLYEYEESIIVCSKDYFNTQIKTSM